MCEICKFCHRQEPNSNETLLCSDCVQKLLALGKDQIRALHAECIKQGQVEKAEVIEKLLIEESDYVPEARKVRANLVRETSLRPVRPAYNKIRA